jgi:broad specificity polyphosphatase/5'/3'-nucleotidase SurE
MDSDEIRQVKQGKPEDDKAEKTDREKNPRGKAENRRDSHGRKQRATTSQDRNLERQKEKSVAPLRLDVDRRKRYRLLARIFYPERNPAQRPARRQDL